MFTHKSLSLTSVVLVFCIQAWYSPATATAVLVNYDLINNSMIGTVPVSEEDVHVRLSSSQPFSVPQIFSQGVNNPFAQVPLQPGTITTITGTNDVEIDWKTFPSQSVGPGQEVHVGFVVNENCSRPGCQVPVAVTQSFWTPDNIPTTGLVTPTTIIPPIESTSWQVDRVTLGDLAMGPEGPHLVPTATMWYEREGAQDTTFLNFTSTAVYGTIATAVFADEVPLDDLNPLLSGFGPDSAVQLFAPVPEPTSWSLFCTGLAALMFGKFWFGRFREV
jgi:hypothetical protein